MMDECVTRILLAVFGAAMVCFQIFRIRETREAERISIKFEKLHRQIDDQIREVRTARNDVRTALDNVARLHREVDELKG